MNSLYGECETCGKPLPPPAATGHVCMGSPERTDATEALARKVADGRVTGPEDDPYVRGQHDGIEYAVRIIQQAAAEAADREAAAPQESGVIPSAAADLDVEALAAALEASHKQNEVPYLEWAEVVAAAYAAALKERT